MMELYVEIDNNLELIGSVRKFIDNNEEFYIVERYGMFPVCYNSTEINEILSKFTVKEVK